MYANNSLSNTFLKKIKINLLKLIGLIPEPFNQTYGNWRTVKNGKKEKGKVKERKIS